jgi:hypothetical protein
MPPRRRSSKAKKSRRLRRASSKSFGKRRYRSTEEHKDPALIISNIREVTTEDLNSPQSYNPFNGVVTDYGEVRQFHKYLRQYVRVGAEGEHPRQGIFSGPGHYRTSDGDGALMVIISST